MNILKKKTKKFLVLVPHRDARLELQKYSGHLIKAGLTGVYEFPLAAVLAEISSNLNADELKSVSRALRDTIKEGKFKTSIITSVDFPAGRKLTGDHQKGDPTGILFGHQVEIDLSAAVFSRVEKKIIKIFSPLIIGEFFSLDKIFAKFDIKKIPIPEISFRAASIANMSWRPSQTAGINDKSDEESLNSKEENGEISYKWKIGKLCWLPKR